MFNLCMRAINTHPTNPFSTYSVYLVLYPGNGKSDKSLTVVDIILHVIFVCEKF